MVEKSNCIQCGKEIEVWRGRPPLTCSQECHKKRISNKNKEMWLKIKTSREPCKNCGTPQTRKFIEKYNMCSNCWKELYRRKRKVRQSCKICGVFRRNYNKVKCWEEDLCRNCANPINKVIKIKKKRVCQCGEVMVKLSYIKRQVHVGTDFRVCTKCSYISIDRNTKYNIATLI